MTKRRPTRREAADAARERAAHTKEPTKQDRALASAWFELLRSGEASEKDLARVLTAVRFDSAYVRKLEAELVNLRRDRSMLEASLRSIGSLRHLKAAALRNGQ